MRNGLIIFVIVVSCASTTIGQDQSNPKGAPYVIVPSESVVLVATSQHDSPIEIEDSRLLNPVDGSRRAAFQYVLRNRGTKPIKYVAVYALSSAGTGGGPLYNGHVMDSPLMPGHKVSAGETSLQIVPLTGQKREQLQLAGPVRVILILLVARVEYSDGTVFTDNKTIKALGDYLTDINSEEINLKADPKSLSFSPFNSSKKP